MREPLLSGPSHFIGQNKLIGREDCWLIVAPLRSDDEGQARRARAGAALKRQSWIFAEPHAGIILLEAKIRIVLEGLRGEDGIPELCRKEGINRDLYYRGDLGRGQGAQG